MKVILNVGVLLGLSMTAAIIQACPVTITNDKNYNVFITDPNSGRAVLIEDRWLKGILSRNSMTIDPSLTGLQKWLSKVKLSHEKLDFWVENKAAKDGAQFQRKYQLTQYYCAGASKISMSEIENLVKKPTDRWSVEAIAMRQQAPASCKVSIVNDIKSNVFVINPSAHSGVLVHAAGMLSSGNAQVIAASDTLDVYVEKETAHEFYLKYQISLQQCASQGREIKMSALKSFVEKPAQGISVNLLQEQKSPTKTAIATKASKIAKPTAKVAPVSAQKTSGGILGANAEDQSLREAAPHCEKMPSDMQEQCYYAAQPKEEPLDY